jgi:hypothetical protein
MMKSMPMEIDWHEFQFLKDLLEVTSKRQKNCIAHLNQEVTQIENSIREEQDKVDSKRLFVFGDPVAKLEKLKEDRKLTLDSIDSTTHDLDVLRIVYNKLWDTYLIHIQGEVNFKDDKTWERRRNSFGVFEDAGAHATHWHGYKRFHYDTI